MPNRHPPTLLIRQQKFFVQNTGHVSPHILFTYSNASYIKSTNRPKKSTTVKFYRNQEYVGKFYVLHNQTIPPRNTAHGHSRDNKGYLQQPTTAGNAAVNRK